MIKIERVYVAYMDKFIKVRKYVEFCLSNMSLEVINITMTMLN